MKDSFWNHPLKTLEKALSIGEEIESLQKQLAALLSGESTIEVTMSPRKGKKKTFSTATLAKMRAAQQARWAKVKEAMTSTPSRTRSAGTRTKAKSPKSKPSPATRAKVAAAQRTKWTKQPGELKVAGDALTRPPKKKKKSGLTPEGRARLAAAMKARWAKAKKTGDSPLNA